MTKQQHIQVKAALEASWQVRWARIRALRGCVPPHFERVAAKLATGARAEIIGYSLNGSAVYGWSK